MQSKLPIRVKKKMERKPCCCNKFFEIMIQNPSDTYCSFCAHRGSTVDFRKSNKFLSKSSQTEPHFDSDKKSFTDLKNILMKINNTLETILDTLQDKKEYLYNKLHEDCAFYKKNTVYCSKNKIEKINKRKNNQMDKKHLVGWPDISRLHYDQQPWLKNYMQKIAQGIAQNGTNLVVCPRSQSWICTARPNSCPNINYFQPMGKLFERKTIEMPMMPRQVFKSIGQGDLRVENNHENEDEPEEKTEEIDQFQEIQ